MQQRMRENNPYAYTAILERMMEYRNRGYWNADKKELAILQELILQLDGDIEGQEE
jgi:cobaltochelatase CobN